jgi:hypothetical protein
MVHSTRNPGFILERYVIMTSVTFNANTTIELAPKIKKKDKPVLKPLEKKKRGRKRKPVTEMTREEGEFIVSFD